MRPESIRVNPEVESALADGWPVVALETTIIAHGMPYPTNLETAMAVEEIVRAKGAVPATIGIIAGQITVGLGISVFVTGGIGAVGPGGTTTFDISADLLALSSYPCMTVCAGAKAFMDIGATLEFLETHRVPVVVYRSDTFPLFYTRSSGHQVEWVAQDAEEIAAFFAAKLTLEMGGGMLVGVPIPEEEELPLAVTRAAIDAAMERMQGEGITGKEVTPYVLSAIKEETGGRSLVANIALVKNNASVGAEIAVALSDAMRSLAKVTNLGKA